MSMASRVAGGGPLRTGGPSGMLGADRSQLGDAKFDRDVVRRVLRFARPYRWMLVGYLAVIVAVALIQLVPPLIFRQIIDEAIPQGINEGERGQLHLLAAVAVVAAVGSARLAIVERWLSSRIGEGVIYDLRVARVRPRAAHADLVLHPHPDRRADQPAQQRRHRRPAGPDHDDRRGGVERHHPGHDARRHGPPRVAADAAVARRAAAVHPPRPSGSGGGCRRSPASRWTSTPR